MTRKDLNIHRLLRVLGTVSVYPRAVKGFTHDVGNALIFQEGPLVAVFRMHFQAANPSPTAQVEIDLYACARGHKVVLPRLHVEEAAINSQNFVWVPPDLDHPAWTILDALSRGWEVEASMFAPEYEAAALNLRAHFGDLLAEGVG